MKINNRRVHRAFTTKKIHSSNDRGGKNYLKSKSKGSEILKKNSKNPDRDSVSIQRLPLGLTSLDEDIVKLENLSNRNLTARFDWLEIEQRLIQLGAKKKLEPIVKNFSIKRSGSIEFPEKLHIYRRFEARFSLHEIES